MIEILWASRMNFDIQPMQNIRYPFKTKPDNLIVNRVVKEKVYFFSLRNEKSMRLGIMLTNEKQENIIFDVIGLREYPLKNIKCFYNDADTLHDANYTRIKD